MELDHKTLEDLSIFNREPDYAIFHHLNFTRTNGGRAELEDIFRQPLASRKAVLETQATQHYIQKKIDRWPLEISNGTLMVMNKFLEATDEPIPRNTGSMAFLNSLYFRLFMSSGYSLIRYSLVHFYVFLNGMQELSERFSGDEAPQMIKDTLKQIDLLLERSEIQHFMKAEKKGNMSTQQTILFGHLLRYRHHQTLLKLMQVYYRLDAWYSMACAAEKFQFTLPEFTGGNEPVLDIDQLYHPLLKNPVSYDVKLDQSANFLFLTGANMAGKSTFIKAIGVATFLAHIGMGVPARRMKLSFFEGLLSNIQVQDNIFLGESYFYNEVQRIKKTIQKINDGRRWLILIDEMFKGTNFQDAKQCSTMVIEGLLKMKDSLFVLSTHLYEIAEPLQVNPNITFRYFETAVENEEPQYSYQLKEGISNDRLGFLILKREKVLELLNEIRNGEA